MRKEYTWSGMKKGKFVARRLDYLLLNDTAICYALENSIFSVPSTDHRGLYLNLKVTENKRGPGYYKFNNVLLRDKTFVDNMNATIDNVLMKYSNQSPEDRWELLKMEMREEAKQYSKYIATMRRNTCLDTYHDLDKCEASLASDPNNEDLQRKSQSLKLKLEIIGVPNN